MNKFGKTQYFYKQKSKQMKWKFLTLVSIIFILSSTVFGQQQGSVSASRKAVLKNQLDYRYKGGFYSLERKFNKMITYPDFARANCIMGIVVVSLVVDCEGNLKQIKMKTALGYGTNEEITKFFQSTSGEWNKCEDDKYSRFEIPIQFFIEGTETNMEDALFVCTGEMPGHTCNDDNYYLKKAEKSLEKENGKKALKYLTLLLRRDPYNVTYQDMRTQALALENE